MWDVMNFRYTPQWLQHLLLRPSFNLKLKRYCVFLCHQIITDPLSIPLPAAAHWFSQVFPKFSYIGPPHCRVSSSKAKSIGSFVWQESSDRCYIHNTTVAETLHHCLTHTAGWNLYRWLNASKYEVGCLQICRGSRYGGSRSLHLSDTVLEASSFQSEIKKAYPSHHGHKRDFTILPTSLPTVPVSVPELLSLNLVAKHNEPQSHI